MTALPDFEETEVLALNQPTECLFDPGPHFGKWLQALERFRNRAELSPGVYLQDDASECGGPASWERQLPDQVCSDGTLVVTDHGKLQADVEVNVALIDGHFKGKITATEHVVLENHALVIGEINTPTLTIRSGAIVEGRCYFEPSEPVEAPFERWERPGWQAFKLGFARVWRGRILSVAGKD
jgi:hypothetical protein